MSEFIADSVIANKLLLWDYEFVPSDPCGEE